MILPPPDGAGFGWGSGWGLPMNVKNENIEIFLKNIYQIIVWTYPKLQLLKLIQNPSKRIISFYRIIIFALEELIFILGIISLIFHNIRSN